MALRPPGRHALPEVKAYDQPVVVVCSEGYASSFAAASLRALGFSRVADLDGGYWAWRGWRDDAARQNVVAPAQRDPSRAPGRIPAMDREPRGARCSVARAGAGPGRGAKPMDKT